MTNDPDKHQHWEFKLTLAGIGRTKDEAWNDAVEGFTQDPGSTPDDSESTLLNDDA